MNTASKLEPHNQTDRGTCPDVRLCVYYKSRKKNKINTKKMAQKPVMRAELFVRALRASQNVKRARVRAATSRGREVKDSYCLTLCGGLWPSFSRAYGSRGFPDGRASRVATRAQCQSCWARGRKTTAIQNVSRISEFLETLNSRCFLFGLRWSGHLSSSPSLTLSSNSRSFGGSLDLWIL
jgi:hypothetical protein